MAISTSILQRNDDGARIGIDGINTYYPNKRVTIYIDGSQYDIVEEYTAEYSYMYITITGLSSGTSYLYEVVVEYQVYGDWCLDGSSSGTFTTTGGGGGGGGDTPLFYITYTDEAVTAHIDNAGSYWFAFWLCDPNGTVYDSENDGTRYRTDEFTVPYTLSPNTTYRLRVDYSSSSSGALTSVLTTDGDVEATFTTGGGGGGGDTWTLFEERAGTVSNSFNYPYNNGFAEMTLYRMSITFSQNATVTFSTSGSADTIGWLSEYNQTTWDDTTGRPDNYVASDDDSGDGSNFSLSYNCTAGRVYYLWYRTYGVGGFVGNTITLSVNIEGGGVTPSYTASVINTNQITFSVSNVGSYYLRYFVRLTSDTDDITYDTWQQYSHLTADTSLTVTDLLYNTSYTVNVGYSTDYYSASVTWIGSQEFTTQSAPSPTWEEVYVGDINVTTTDRSVNRSCALMRVYRYNVRFSVAGKVRIYSTGATSSSDVIAYWGTSSNGIDTSTGVPNAYNNVWDDDGSDRNFNSGEITVAANTTYYLWVRCYRNDTTAQIIIYITATTADTGKVWIYTSSGWKQATPYIYNGSSWVKAKAYIYTSSGWKQTT